MIQRGSFAIKTLVLLATSNRRLTRTRIMHELVLTYPRAVRYTEIMVKEGLLDYDPDTKTYGTTPKGFRLLQLSEDLAAFVSPIENMISKYRNYDQTAPRLKVG